MSNLSERQAGKDNSTNDEPRPGDEVVEQLDLEPALNTPETLNDSSRPVWRRVLLLAWPVCVQQLMLMAVGIYDQYLAGNNPPADAALHVPYQAAQTTANYLAWFISSFSALVSVGSTALVSAFYRRASAIERCIPPINPFRSLLPPVC